MARIGEQTATEILKLLVELKDIHDNPDATELDKTYYEIMKPKTWLAARAHLSAAGSQVSGDKELCDIASKISLDAALSQVSAEGYTVYWFNDEQFVPEWQARQLQQRGAHLRELLAHKTAMVEHLDSQLSTPKEEKEEWISVEDRLPEVELECLVYRDLSKSRKGATAKVFDILTFRPETSCLHPRWGITSVTLPSCDVTHWMPLPAPPKQAEQNDKA